MDIHAYTCIEAGGAEEALAALATDQVGIALLDINMPGQSGAELLDEMIGHFPDIAVKPITKGQEILSMFRHHHERYDGTGYPDGLKGNIGEALR